MVYSQGNSINQQKQQQINRSLVIRLLRQQGMCSRAELAKQSGLTSATITKMVAELIEKGLIVEEGLMEGCNGRRAIGIRLNGGKYRVLGAFLSRTHFSLIMMGLSGEIYDTRSYSIQKDWQSETVIEHLCGWMQEMITSVESAEVLAICVAMPGPYTAEGKLVFITNLFDWDDVPLANRLQEHFDIPVLVENDANAGMRGELWFSKESEQIQDMAYILAGQGIGCGILLNGMPLKGSMGVAGEIGHTTICHDGELCECGNRGCLEMYCSTLVLKKNLKERLSKGESSLLSVDFTKEELAEAIRRDDPVACEEYRKVCEFLSVGVINIINQLNPAVVIIGDELADLAPKKMLAVISERLSTSLRPLLWKNTRVAVSTLPYNPTLLGAAAMAAERVFDNPMAFV